MEKTVI